MSKRIFTALCLLMTIGGNVFAHEQAKLFIIAQNFGTVIGVSNTSITKTRNGVSNSQFVTFAESDVKGEWLETIGKPQIDIKYDRWLVITVKIKGVIREIVSAGIDISAKILRNGIDEKSESDTFYNGDDFQSWLSRARKSDYSMIVIPKDIVINK